MLKPSSLRESLAAAFPELQRDPSRLAVFVDAGAVDARREAGGISAFLINYTLNLVVLEWSQSPLSLMMVISQWAAVHQPDLVDASGSGKIAFDADILDNGTTDISFTLPLTERTKLIPTQDGFMLETPDDQSAEENIISDQLLGIFAHADPVAVVEP